MNDSLTRMRDLCLLHERDPVDTGSRSVLQIVQARDQLTWTDVQTILRRQGISWDLMEIWADSGRLSRDKLRFASDARTFLADRKAAGPLGPYVHAFPSIYDVVWGFGLLEDRKTAYRGQFSARWPLQSSLLRPPTDRRRLDVQTLVGRAEATEAFVRKLRTQQSTLFGKELDERSLLAIAQHFGFPTPLLDFTRSLRIAAFFATLAARNLHGNEPVCGVIYHIDLETKQRIESPGEELGVPLLEILDISIGELEVVEPDIPSEDDRIRRQQGIFIGGFQVHDLSGFAVDRILFWQQPGLVFEDPRNGVDEQALLPDRTPLSDLALRVRQSCESRSRERGLGIVELPEPGVIGSRGSLLLAQISEATDFFSGIADALAGSGLYEETEHVASILRRYLQDIRDEKYVGPLPRDGSTKATDNALFGAVASLAEWSQTNERTLWKFTYGQLSGGPSEYDYGRPESPPMPRLSSDRGRIAVAVALYLAGWEHLRYVNGTRARRLAAEAQRLLRESGKAV